MCQKENNHKKSSEGKELTKEERVFVELLAEIFVNNVLQKIDTKSENLQKDKEERL